MTEIRPGRFQVLPVIIKNLIIINVIMVLLQLTLFSAFHINLDDYLALHYWRSGLFGPWQLVTHIFMHGSPDPRQLQETIAHIFFNMFALWTFGSVLESMWGPKRFLIFYLICGVGAALCQMGVQAIHLEQIVKGFNEKGPMYHEALQQALHTKPGAVERNIFDEPMVGASGAIMGVLFAFGYLFPNMLIYLYFFVPLKAKWLVIIYAVIELGMGVMNSAGDNVAHFAHLGGMLFGFILLRIWHSREKARYY